MSYFKLNVNLSERVRMDGFFLGLPGLLLGTSLGLCPREIPRSSPASPQKTPSIPPLLLGLTHSGGVREDIKKPSFFWTLSKSGLDHPPLNLDIRVVTFVLAHF